MTIEPKRLCGPRVALGARLASCALVLTMQACSLAAQSRDSTDIQVGALLPFTGELAASGAEYERALVLAVETVNQAGGISGHRLRLVARDTHSDVERGIESARALFESGPTSSSIGWTKATRPPIRHPYPNRARSDS